LPFCKVTLGVVDAQAIKPFLIGLAKVDGHFLDSGENDEQVSVDQFGQFGAGAVLIDNRSSPLEMEAMARNRNTAAAAGNDDRAASVRSPSR